MGKYEDEMTILTVDRAARRLGAICDELETRLAKAEADLAACCGGDLKPAPHAPNAVAHSDTPNPSQ